VPELASRAHIESIAQIVQTSLDTAGVRMEDIAGVAVTTGPGLIGALAVGAQFAKGLALRYGLPVVPVNHIEGHIYSSCVEHDECKPPFVALVVSGGHTTIFHVKSFDEYEPIGSTRDDAAGEAFDKIAKLMGFGYPGGKTIDDYAQKGNPTAYTFPRGMIHEPHADFSFSGLKTSVRTFLQKEFPKEQYPSGIPAEKIPDICASVQAAIVDVLAVKTVRIAKELNVKTIVITGGVAANSGLRARMHEEASKRRWKLFTPSLLLCTDNAGMIGYVGRQKLLAGVQNQLDFTVSSQAIRAKRPTK
jgi:N6-L-threonylcarbamoyladenine synthase